MDRSFASLNCTAEGGWL